MWRLGGAHQTIFERNGLTVLNLQGIIKLDPVTASALVPVSSSSNPASASVDKSLPPSPSPAPVQMTRKAPPPITASIIRTVGVSTILKTGGGILPGGRSKSSAPALEETESVIRVRDLDGKGNEDVMAAFKFEDVQQGEKEGGKGEGGGEGGKGYLTETAKIKWAGALKEIEEALRD